MNYLSFFREEREIISPLPLGKGMERVKIVEGPIYLVVLRIQGRNCWFFGEAHLMNFHHCPHQATSVVDLLAEIFAHHRTYFLAEVLSEAELQRPTHGQAPIFFDLIDAFGSPQEQAQYPLVEFHSSEEDFLGPLGYSDEQLLQLDLDRWIEAQPRLLRPLLHSQVARQEDPDDPLLARRILMKDTAALLHFCDFLAGPPSLWVMYSGLIHINNLLTSLQSIFPLTLLGEFGHSIWNDHISQGCIPLPSAEWRAVLKTGLGD